MAIRPGFHTITPYLTTPDLEGLLTFVKNAFDGTETLRERGGGGGFHVELKIGDSMIMIGEIPKSSTSTSSAMLYLYVDDPDATYARAVQAGASSIMEPATTPDGERRSGV